MNCYHCGTELIWGGDNDCDEHMEWYGYLIETNLSCPKCNSLVIVYGPKEHEEEL